MGVGNRIAAAFANLIPDFVNDHHRTESARQSQHASNAIKFYQLVAQKVNSREDVPEYSRFHVFHCPLAQRFHFVVSRARSDETISLIKLFVGGLVLGVVHPIEEIGKYRVVNSDWRTRQ